MSARRNISVTSGLTKPDFKAILRKSKKFPRLFNYAMYYAHYELGDKRLKTETVKYAKTIKLDYKALESLDNHRFSVLGKAAYLLNNGAELSTEWQFHMANELPELIELAGIEAKRKAELKDEESPTAKKTKVISIQDRLKMKSREIASEIDGWIDSWMISPTKFDAKKYDPLKLFRSASLKAGHVRHIMNFYKSDMEEIQIAIKGTDAYITESYECYSKAHMKKILALYKKVEESCTMIIEASLVERAPRVKKPMSIAKQIEKLRYAKESVDMGLVSINPIDIPGAKELWVYNAKTRKLGKYVALDESGLGVKGTSITNYSDKSIEKTVRKPQSAIADFRKATKRAQRKFLDSIMTLDIKLKGRINEHCILLKVMR